MFSQETSYKISQIKKTILKRKIMLLYMIERSTLLNKIYNSVLIAVTVSTPAISAIDKIITGNNERTSDITTILGAVIFLMIQLKDYLHLDALKNNAVEQSIKYRKLHEEIDREINKFDKNNLEESDLLYWINDKIYNIEISDPEFTLSAKNKFAEVCKKRRIEYLDEENDYLNNLENEIKRFSPLGTGASATAPSATAPSVTAPSVTAPSVTAPSVTAPSVTAPSVTVDNYPLNSHSADLSRYSVLYKSRADLLPTSVVVSGVASGVVSGVSSTEFKTRAHSSLYDTNLDNESRKKEFKESTKNINVTEDINWTMERMKDINVTEDINWTMERMKD